MSALPASLRLGIEKLHVYPGQMSLDLHTLCAARGMDADRTVADLMIRERSVNPSWEDAVTMGVNAALPILTDEDRAEIGLLLVGTESSVDQEKPSSSWIHHFLGLRSDCMNLEIKHACYAATGALDLAMAWLSSPVGKGKKALVVSTDQTTLTLNEPWEPVCGAGAAAALISLEPRFIEYEIGKCGVFAHEVSDVIRPNMRTETGNSETSLLAYLHAIENAFAKYQEVVGEDVNLDSYFQRLVYHTPFGGMTYRAHRTLLMNFTDIPLKQAKAHFERMTGTGRIFNSRMGATYGASTFIALTGLLGFDDAVKAGDRLGLFAYGSGSCSQFYSARVLPEAREIARAVKLGEQLDARRPLTVEEYEAVEHERDLSVGVPEFTPKLDRFPGFYESHYAGKRLLTLRGIHEYYREYDFS